MEEILKILTDIYEDIEMNTIDGKKFLKYEEKLKTQIRQELKNAFDTARKGRINLHGPINYLNRVTAEAVYQYSTFEDYAKSLHLIDED